MIGSDTVFIVGAGASREFGMPTGAELLADIEKLSLKWSNGHFSGSHVLRDLLGDLGLESRSMEAATGFVSRNMALAPSIDNFLHTHRDNESVRLAGKAMIALALSQAEQKSSLYAQPRAEGQELRIPFGKPHSKIVGGRQVDHAPAPGKTWLGKIFWLLVSGRGYEEFCEALSRIKFICFNYDSCIEQFLAFAIRSYFDRDPEEVQALVDRVEIIRPYGSLRDYEYLPGTQVFGSLDGAHLLEASRRIRTFTESADTDFGERSAACLEHAKTVVFLGFGYLELNMQRLFGERLFVVERVLGSALGMSEETMEATRRKVIENVSRGTTNGRPHPTVSARAELQNLRCAELIDFHWAFFESELLAKLS